MLRPWWLPDGNGNGNTLSRSDPLPANADRNADAGPLRGPDPLPDHHAGADGDVSGAFFERVVLGCGFFGEVRAETDADGEGGFLKGGGALLGAGVSRILRRPFLNARSGTG